MKKIIGLILLVASLSANASEFTGDLNFYTPGSDHPLPFGEINGSIDVNAGNITIDHLEFALAPATISSVELLPEGNYIRYDAYGMPLTFEVGPEQVGGFFKIMSIFGEVTVVNVWDIILLNGQQVLQPTDNDGDGTLGHASTDSPFYNLNMAFVLTLTEPVPGVTLEIDVANGTLQECAGIGGHIINASVTATPYNDAVIESLYWSVDGQVVTNGYSFSQFLSVGTHTLSVTATITTGAQYTVSQSVYIPDTTPPVITASFNDQRTGSVITVIDSKNTSFVSANFNATDICDPAPQIQAIGGFSLTDGDRLKIQGNQDKVQLTTSELKMSVIASDIYGNQTEMTKTLKITQ